MELARDNPSSKVEIDSRLDRFGNDNPKGHTYVFTITPKKKTLDTLEGFYEAFDEAEEFETEDYENRASYHTDEN